MRVNIILSLFIIFHFLSCNGNSQTISNTETDLQKENLKGKVILVVDGVNLRFYNKNGNLVKESNSESESSSYKTYQYQDLIIKSINSKTVFKDFERTDLFNYDSNGKLISRKSSYKLDPKSITYEYFMYNDKNLLTTRKLENTSKNYNNNQYEKDIYLTKYYYNGDGKIDSTIDGKLSKSNITFFDTYTKDIFNTESQVISSESYEVKNGLTKLIQVSKFRYNEKGDYSEKIENDIVNNTINRYTYSYQYDSYGNWIILSIYNNDKLDFEQNRRLFYEAQDISLYENKYKNIVASIDVSNQYFEESLNAPKQNKSSSSQNNTFSNQNNSNISTQNKKKEVEWITCPDCAGRGFRLCMDCTGRGSMKCDYCYGRGWKNYGNEKQTCNTCGGTGEKTCKRCNGKGNLGSCICRGKGVVQKY